MEKAKIDKILYEIGGFRPHEQSAGKHVGPYDFDPHINSNQQIKKLSRFKSPFQLTGWQEELRNEILKRPRQDVFVNIMPAGGKTSPLVDGWFQSPYINLNNRLDKICWVCPTVQLANQVYHNDLKPKLLQYFQYHQNNQQLYDIFLNSGIIPSTGPTPYGFPATLDPKNIPHEKIFNLVLGILNRFTHLHTGPGASGNLNINTIVSVCTYSFATQIIEKQQPDIVVIDETQQYFPIGEDKEFERARQFIQTMRFIPKNSSLIMLTGSMNRESGLAVKDFINLEFKRRLKYVNAPEARNRARINVLPHHKLDKPEDLKVLIKDLIQQRSTHNCIVVFNVNKKILEVGQALLRELPQRSIETVTGKEPRINSQSYDIYNQDSLITPEKPLSFNDSINYISKQFENPQFLADWLQFMLNSPTEIDFKNKAVQKNEGNKNQAVNISDPFLAKCLLAGFGYLAGGQKRDRRMTNKDIMVVQTLFKTGKIYCLLATDMIGVGTTLTIKDLYVPSLNKQQGSSHGPIDDSSLIQLLHRTGRSGDITGNIYCAPEDIKRVWETMSKTNNPEETIQNVNIDKSLVVMLQDIQTSLLHKIKYILTMI